jgi:hypothetical protein
MLPGEAEEIGANPNGSDGGDTVDVPVVDPEPEAPEKDAPAPDAPTEAVAPAAAVAAEPPPNPLEAMRRHWWLIALLVLLGAGGGVAYGLTRDPTHTAEARVSVGRVDVATQSVPGWATASQILADSYSRAIVADRVILAVTRRTGVSTERFLQDVSASPIPQTGVVRISADGGSRPEAMRLANASATALVLYVRNLNRANPEAARLLAQYKAATQAYGQAIAQRAKLRGDQTDAIIRAEARLQQERLRLGTIEGLYRTSQVGQASPNTLQVLAYAATTTTDRNSMLQRVIFGGAVAGLLLGSLLAIVLARARARRRSATA